MGYADVGADIYLALGLVAFYAAGASPWAIAIAAVTYICTGLAYAELATVYPYAGGAQVYAMRAFNDLTGFIAGWAMMLDYTIDISLFSLATTGYLSYFFPSITGLNVTLKLMGNEFVVHGIGIVAVVLIALLLVINYAGIRESSILNESLVTFSLVVEAIVLLAGFALAFSLDTLVKQLQEVGANQQFINISYVLPNYATNYQNFIYGITLAMTSFIGIESIAQAAQETRRPHRSIPRATKLSIVSVLAFALGLMILAMGMMPWQVLANAQADPMRALAERIPLVGQYLAPVVALTGFAICYVSTNTGVIGVSRVAYSMGRFRLFPQWFYKVHPRFRTPHRTILLFGAIGALFALIGELHFVADLYNFGALLAYIIVNASLIKLRNSEHEAYRPWKVPGDVVVAFNGKRIIIPIVSVVGVISCTAIWLLVLAFHPEGRMVGLVWIIIGVLGYMAYRRHLRMPALGRRVADEITPVTEVLNAVVLVRIPEDEDSLVESLVEGLDKRFRLTLLAILNSAELGLSLEEVRDFEQVVKIRESSLREISRIVRKLRARGYECTPKVDVGEYENVIRHYGESGDCDAIVLVKRTMVRQAERVDSVYAAASRYPGKLMVVRRA